MSLAAKRRTALIACSGVTVEHGRGEALVRALSGVSIEIAPGEALAVRGPSGSGKTTLLHVLGGLVEPTAGDVTWRGRPLETLEQAATRRQDRRVAIVFQGANLLPHLSAWENVAFVLAARGREDEGPTPGDLLELVGLGAKLEALPAELSGGEAQRVAIARALAQEPELLLCDEPTGHLDADTGRRVLDLIDALHEREGFALIVATHDLGVASRYGREIELRDGEVIR